MNRWSATTEVAVERFVHWLSIAKGKFYRWRGRYGHVNEQNASIPREH